MLLRTHAAAGLEELFRRLKKTEVCFCNLRRREAGKVATFSLKSESKKTECTDTGSKVAVLGWQEREEMLQA